MKIRVWIVALVLLTCEAGYSQTTTLKVDGNFWNGLNQGQKYGFAVGYVSGYMDAKNQSWLYKNAGAKQSVDPYKLTPENLTFGQIMDGVTIFYKDYRNLQLPLSCAVTWVVMGVNGSTDAQREGSAESCRKFVADHPS